MGKSSASHKRKRSKNSSKAKASSRSKSRKYKSKKVCRREVSLSSSEYDDSKGLNTSASSSSEDSYRRRRDRSGTRKDVKGRRKRARKRSYSRDSSKDSRHARRRKKVKRKNEYEVREKPFQKKMLRKEASVSSMSGGSWSCSTCQGGSASSDDSQFENRRGRLKRKVKDKRKLERGRSRSEKSSRYRARSCSSCSPCGESSDEGTEVKYIGENNSRWLRSVITATKEVEECRELYANETKEEIVDDHDYPCRSNESNDGGTKRQLDHHTLPASEENLIVEDEIGDVNADYNFTEPKIRDRSYHDGSNFKDYGAGTSESMKKTSETSGANLSSDDLESILRQRALENLRKFRGEIQSTAKACDQKIKFVGNVKQPITDEHELVQGKSIVSDAAVETKFDRKVLVEENSLPVGRKDLITYPKNNESILNMDKGKSGSAKHQLTCAPEKVIDSDNPRETITESTTYRTNNPELTTPESCHTSFQSHSSLKQTPVSELSQEKLVVAESNKDWSTFEEAVHAVSQSSNDDVSNIRRLSSATTEPSSHGPKFRDNISNKEQDEVKEHSRFELKQTSASHEPPYAKFLVTEGDVEKNIAAKTTQPAIQSSNNNGKVVDELCNSTTPTPCFGNSSVENSSDKLQDESNRGSQFEQKTMNVMRGGEMVQVSYKVYIPKKAPALARRQLKR